MGIKKEATPPMNSTHPLPTRRAALRQLGCGFGYETDEFGHHAVIDKVHMHDLHATLLHALGLDHEKLT